MEYIVKKKEFKKEDINFMEIFFDNGECLFIPKDEIIDISLKLYDKLVIGTNYWNSFCAVVKSGFIKLKLKNKVKNVYENSYFVNQKGYNRDRIGFIKNRLCDEQGVSFIKLFNENNWSFTFYCQAEANQEADNLILKFIPYYKKAEYKSDMHVISLPEIKKSIISRFELDFENCEGVYIDKKEIVDMQLVLSKELCWGSEDYVRKIEAGFLKIRLDPELNQWRKNSLFINLAKEKKGNKQIESRLCGKKGFDLHDICHLYIDYDYAGYGTYKRECVDIDDIRSEEEFEEIEKLEEKEDREISPYFLGGFAEKLDKDTILITFGKTSLKDARCKNMLEECSLRKVL